MGGTTGIVPEGVAFLLGSETRLRVFAAFEDGPRRQAAVARACDLGRSTVHRCVDGLERHGWVRECGDGYALTATGERVLSAYRSFADTVECVSTHAPLLRCLEAVDVSVSTAALEAGELVTATEHDPHAATVAGAETMRAADADQVRTAFSGVTPIANSAGEDFLAGGGTVELTLDRRTLLAARRSYYENYQLALASDRVDLFVIPDPVEVGVLLAGDRAALTGYEDGRATVCLRGDDDVLVDCAEAVYREVRDRATRLAVRYPTPEEVTPESSRPSPTPLADGDGRDPRR